MMVKLVRHTPEPERTVAMSARLCYSPIGAAQLEEKISDEQAANLVRKLVKHGALVHLGACYLYLCYRRRIPCFDTSAGAPPYCFLFPAISALCEGA